MKEKFLALAKEAHEIAVSKGFWPEFKERNRYEAMALIHAELSEALEAARNEKDYTSIWFEGSDGKKPEGVAVELADTLIRIGDFVEGFGLHSDRTGSFEYAYRCGDNFGAEICYLHEQLGRADLCYQTTVAMLSKICSAFCKRDIFEVAKLKMAYNKTRVHRHGRHF